MAAVCKGEKKKKKLVSFQRVKWNLQNLTIQLITFNFMYGCSSDYLIDELNITSLFKSQKDTALQVIWKTLMFVHLLYIDLLFVICF